MNTQDIIKALERTDGSFPGKEITAAREQKNEIIPALLELLKNTVRNIDQVRSEENYFAYIYAMFLLAEFREKRALNTIVDLLSLPGETTWELIGDIMTEDLGRILASVSCGECAGLEKLIENEDLDELVRAAAIDAMLILLVKEELPREDLITYFRSLYQSRLKKEGSLVWNHLVVSSINIYPEELLEQIKEAYLQELADEEFIPYQYVEDALLSGKETVLGWLENNPDYSLVTDSISDIGRWLS
ncbi:DUF1186 family protein [bacterium]|nr:DUF1186 family protein [bacterium]